MNQNETTSTQKLAIAGVLTAAAVAGSLISVPVAGSKCAPCPAYGQCICRRHPRSVVGCRNRVLRKPDP